MKKFLVFALVALVATSATAQTPPETEVRLVTETGRFLFDSSQSNFLGIFPVGKEVSTFWGTLTKDTRLSFYNREPLPLAHLDLLNDRTVVGMGKVRCGGTTGESSWCNWIEVIIFVQPAEKGT